MQGPTHAFVQLGISHLQLGASLRPLHGFSLSLVVLHQLPHHQIQHHVFRTATVCTLANFERLLILHLKRKEGQDLRYSHPINLPPHPLRNLPLQNEGYKSADVSLKDGL